jgi:hypothetical protein
MARTDYEQAAPRSVIISAHFGTGSAKYAAAFFDAKRFPAMLKEVNALLIQRRGVPSLHPTRLALVAWSAGYASVGRLLAQNVRQPPIDAVFLLDGLHADYKKAPSKKARINGSPASPKEINTKGLKPFVTFAKSAAGGHNLMVLTHSSIQPPGYASTTETCSYLLRTVGVVPEESPSEDPLGSNLLRRAHRQDFHVFGFAGEGKPAHIGHLHLVAPLLKAYLLPRWSEVATEPRPARNPTNGR